VAHRPAIRLDARATAVAAVINSSASVAVATSDLYCRCVPTR
jgi:hypothetical protein